MYETLAYEIKVADENLWLDGSDNRDRASELPWAVPFRRETFENSILLEMGTKRRY